MTSHPKCGLTWTSLTQLHCPICCRHFGGEESYTNHRLRTLCQPADSALFMEGIYFSPMEYLNHLRMQRTRGGKGEAAQEPPD